ncbi:MAG: 50S ribosomal protein L25/general stress protein Ctc [Mariprofundaceae bacterium]
MSSYTLEAEVREQKGKGNARRLRRDGKLPGILYGGSKPEVSLSIDSLSLSKLIEDAGFHTSLLELKIKGASGKNTALVKDIQWDPLTDNAVHIDFHRVSSKDTVHIEVPVVTVGHEKCPGAIKGGFFDSIRHTLEVVCRADLIPDSIEIDCSSMDIGDVVHVEDISLPDGVEIPHDTNFTVLTILAPTVEEAPETDEEELTAAEEEKEATE